MPAPLKANRLFFTIIFVTLTDLIAVTETCFNDKDCAARFDCTPPNYCLTDCHRTDSRRGGTALLYKDDVPVKKAFSAILNSFEFSEWKIRPCRSWPLKLIIIYRTPYSTANPVSMGTFFQESSNYLESVILYQYLF